MRPKQIVWGFVGLGALVIVLTEGLTLIGIVRQQFSGTSRTAPVVSSDTQPELEYQVGPVTLNTVHTEVNALEDKWRWMIRVKADNSSDSTVILQCKELSIDDRVLSEPRCELEAPPGESTDTMVQPIPPGTQPRSLTLSMIQSNMGTVDTGSVTMSFENVSVLWEQEPATDTK